MTGSLFRALADAERAGLRRPWELIWNEVPAKNFVTGKPQGTCPDPLTLRIVDADRRLILRIKCDREQVTTAEEMVLIMEAVNAL